MVEVRKATAEDFDDVYPLLYELDPRRKEKEGWRRLFTEYWEREEDHFGYVLVEGNRVVGFLGTIFSKRFIGNKIEKFCNLTSWIVKKEFRRSSMQLMSRVLKLEGYTITNFHPARVTRLILKQLGFKCFETTFRLVLPVPVFAFFRGKCFVEFDEDKIKSCLNKLELKIYCDHSKFNCIHMVVRTEKEHSYIIMKKTIKRGIPFVQVHYSSNPDIFTSCINKVIVKICMHLHVFGLIVDERYLNGRTINYSIAKKTGNFVLFKSNSLAPNDINQLYTELFVLDI